MAATKRAGWGASVTCEPAPPLPPAQRFLSCRTRAGSAACSPRPASCACLYEFSCLVIRRGPRLGPGAAAVLRPPSAPKPSTSSRTGASLPPPCTSTSRRPGFFPGPPRLREKPPGLPPSEAITGGDGGVEGASQSVRRCCWIALSRRERAGVQVMGRQQIWAGPQGDGELSQAIWMCTRWIEHATMRKAPLKSLPAGRTPVAPRAPHSPLQCLPGCLHLAASFVDVCTRPNPRQLPQTASHDGSRLRGAG